MATVATTMVVESRPAIIMLTITRAVVIKLSSLHRICNTRETSRTCTEDRSNCKVRTREWIFQESTTPEICLRTRWTQEARFFPQFRPTMAALMEGHRLCKIKCTASVGKITDSWKIGRKRLGRVSWVEEKALRRSMHLNMHTVMTELKLNCNSWTKYRLQMQCPSKLNQWEKDQQQWVWIRKTTKISRGWSHSCRPTANWVTQVTTEAAWFLQLM